MKLKIDSISSNLDLRVLNDSEQNVSFFLDPFPHAVIENVFSDEIYSQLEEHYPSDQTIIENDLNHTPAKIKDNSRYQISYINHRENPNLLSPLWQTFYEQNTDLEMYQRVMQLTKEVVLKYYPKIANQLLHPASIGRRRVDDNTSPIVMDCQAGINTPVTQMGRVIGSHLDNHNELFALLFYLKNPNDFSKGGDLELQKWRHKFLRFQYGKQRIPGFLTEKINTVQYAENKAILFLNTPVSIHSVSPREVTPYSRRLVNIIAETYPSIHGGLFSKNSIAPEIRFISKIYQSF